MCSFRLPIRRFSLSQPASRRSFRKRAFLVATALLFAFACPRARALGPHGDLFAGYSHLWSSPDSDNGWQVDGHLKVAPFLGVEASVSGYSIESGGNGYLYLFGPRATVGVRKVHLFAHFLAGGSHANGDNNFLYGGGGGLDFGIIPHIAWRVGGDILHQSSGSNNAGTVSTGPVLRF